MPFPDGNVFVMTPEEKAARRAQALARLEATKERLRQGIAAKDLSLSSKLDQKLLLKKQLGQQRHENQAPAANVRNAKVSKTHKTGLFSKPYIDYDFSTLQDSHGGFMTEESTDSETKNSWLDSLQPVNPPYPFDDPRAPQCYECGTKELDFRLWKVFNARVCRACRLAKPEKYSLLTKTDCRLDYLLTEPELRDKEILPHMERPNPYKSTFANMMLYLRYQVEDFAFNKWGGPEGLDGEWERREKMKKLRKQAKFEMHIREIRNKTRAQTITGTNRKVHRHKWDEGVKQADGEILRRCDCGMTQTEYKL